MKLQINRSLALGLAFLISAMANCSKAQQTSNSGATVEDSSASGAAAGAAGGALSTSSSSGTQASMSFALPQTLLASMKSALNPLPHALASGFCPTFRSTSNQCSAIASTMWLNYQDCTFAGAAVWNGVQAITMSSGSATCGTFPNPGASGTLYRQYVQAVGSSTPGQITLESNSASGIVDDATSNLGNFDGDSIPTLSNGGYGSVVTFAANGARNGITLGHHIYVTGEFNHSITGNLAIAESAGSSSRTISGTVKVYHNLLKVVGTSTFDNVVHDDVCCLPISGSISTLFSEGTNVSPSVEGLKMVGATETLTFTGCGTATLQNYDNTTVNVSLKRCF